MHLPASHKSALCSGQRHHRPAGADLRTFSPTRTEQDHDQTKFGPLRVVGFVRFTPIRGCPGHRWSWTGTYTSAGHWKRAGRSRTRYAPTGLVRLAYVFSVTLTVRPGSTGTPVSRGHLPRRSHVLGDDGAASQDGGTMVDFSRPGRTGSHSVRSPEASASARPWQGLPPHFPTPALASGSQPGRASGSSTPFPPQSQQRAPRLGVPSGQFAPAQNRVPLTRTTTDDGLGPRAHDRDGRHHGTLAASQSASAHSDRHQNDPLEPRQALAGRLNPPPRPPTYDFRLPSIASLVSPAEIGDGYRSYSQQGQPPQHRPPTSATSLVSELPHALDLSPSSRDPAPASRGYAMPSTAGNYPHMTSYAVSRSRSDDGPDGLLRRRLSSSGSRPIVPVGEVGSRQPVPHRDDHPSPSTFVRSWNPHHSQDSLPGPYGSGMAAGGSGAPPMAQPTLKAYRCLEPFCGKVFPRPSSLRVHMFSHTGQKPFKCHVCDRAFSVPSNLKRHQRELSY